MYGDIIHSVIQRSMAVTYCSFNAGHYLGPYYYRSGYLMSLLSAYGSQEEGKIRPRPRSKYEAWIDNRRACNYSQIESIALQV
jgi:hypothetical protein